MQGEEGRRGLKEEDRRQLQATSGHSNEGARAVAA